MVETGFCIDGLFPCLEVVVQNRRVCTTSSLELPKELLSVEKRLEGFWFFVERVVYRHPDCLSLSLLLSFG